MGSKVFKSVKYNSYLIGEGDRVHGHPDYEMHGDKGKWHVENHDGGKVSLKGHHGHFIAVDVNHKLYLASNHDSQDTRFFLEKVDSFVALRSHSGGYIGLEADGHVHVVLQLGEEELFTETDA